MRKYASLARHKWSLPFETVMAVGAAVTLAQGDLKHFAVAIFTCIVGFAPLWFERLVGVRLPTLIHVLYTAFIFASMFAGEVLGLYGRIWEWDDAMHFISGLLLGVGGVMLLTEMSRRKIHLPVWVQTMLIVSVASLVAVLWEIVEFGSDEFFGTNSQGGDLYDTMTDLLYSMAGSLIVALVFLVHLKGKTVRFFTHLVDSYVQLNR